jgi:hypothetical protein
MMKKPGTRSGLPKGCLTKVGERRRGDSFTGVRLPFMVFAELLRPLLRYELLVLKSLKLDRPAPS